MPSIQEKKFFVRFKSAVMLFLALAGMCFGQSTWEQINPLPQGNDLYSVTYANNLFVAVGYAGTILTSPDGTTWTISNSGTAKVLCSVIYVKNQFVAVGDTILTSPDGLTWTTRNSGTSYGLTCVTYGNGQFVAGTGTPYGPTLTSPDGATWTVGTVFTGTVYTSMAFGNGQFVAVGMRKIPFPVILTSADGTTWTGQNSGVSTTNYFESVIYGNSRFVVVGTNGTIVTSSDGVTWTIQNSGTTDHLLYVSYGNNRFVVTSMSGGILTSPDGMTWSIQNSGTPNALLSVTCGNGLFVAVGAAGTILISKADPTAVVFQPSVKNSISGLKINVTNNCISSLIPFSGARRSLKVGLFTIAGKQIYSATTEAHNGILNIPTLGFPAGKYFLSITDGDNKTLNSSIVLMR
jgi:hypothetical protein